MSDEPVPPWDSIHSTILTDPTEHIAPPEKVLHVAVRGPVVCLDISTYDETGTSMTLTRLAEITVSTEALAEALIVAVPHLMAHVKVKYPHKYREGAK